MKMFWWQLLYDGTSAGNSSTIRYLISGNVISIHIHNESLSKKNSVPDLGVLYNCTIVEYFSKALVSKIPP